MIVKLSQQEAAASDMGAKYEQVPVCVSCSLVDVRC